jgi:Fic family protein
MHRITNITITSEILKLIAEIDEFKGRWTVIETLAPEKLTSLRRIATIESVGSSTRIEGSKLSDADVEKLLSGLKTHSGHLARPLRRRSGRSLRDTDVEDSTV